MPRTRTASYKNFLHEYEALIRLHHPRMKEAEAASLAYRLAEITERFYTVVKGKGKKRRDQELSELPEYQRFKDELRSVPVWFRRYLEQK